MASADYSVLTPERVSLEYGIAGIGSRAGAALVDTLLQAVALAVVTAALVGGVAIVMALRSGGESVNASSAGVLLLALWSLALFLISTGYFMLFEIVWNGQTPGKRLLGLRVIRDSGYPLRPVDAVIRNLVRIVDWLPVLYGLGVVVMLLNARSKRLGDFASGTLVVREGARGALFPIRPVQAIPEQPLAVVLSGADATLVRDFLVRRDSMHPSARRELARRLAVALSQRYQLRLEASSEPEAFLEQLTG